MHMSEHWEQENRIRECENKQEAESGQEKGREEKIKHKHRNKYREYGETSKER